MALKKKKTFAQGSTSTFVLAMVLLATGAGTNGPKVLSYEPYMVAVQCMGH